MEESLHIHVNDKYSSEEMFQNLFHNLCIPALPSLDWNTCCWGVWTAKHWPITSSRISEYFLMEIQPFSAILHLTTQTPKSLQYKEPIKHVHRFQYPRNIQLPTLPTLHNWKIAHHDEDWWPARPSHTEGGMDYWRELFRSTFANSTTELYI